MSHFCPSCGFNLSADQPIVSGEWVLTPTVMKRGRTVVRLTMQQAGIIYTIAAAGGATVSIGTILSRVSGEDVMSNIVPAQLCRVRKVVPDIPIEAVWGAGYRWTG